MADASADRNVRARALSDYKRKLLEHREQEARVKERLYSVVVMLQCKCLTVFKFELASAILINSTKRPRMI